MNPRIRIIGDPGLHLLSRVAPVRRSLKPKVFRGLNVAPPTKSLARSICLSRSARWRAQLPVLRIIRSLKQTGNSFGLGTVVRVEDNGRTYI